jgi:hypothetical protein
MDLSATLLLLFIGMCFAVEPSVRMSIDEVRYGKSKFAWFPLRQICWMAVIFFSRSN